MEKDGCRKALALHGLLKMLIGEARLLQYDTHIQNRCWLDTYMHLIYKSPEYYIMILISRIVVGHEDVSDGAPMTTYLPRMNIL